MLHGEGWFKEFDIDIAKAPDDELLDVFKSIFDYQVITFKNQKLDTKTLLRFVNLIGTPQKSAGKIDIWDDPEGVMRVGGKDIIKGQSLFDHDHDLDWHANQPSNPNRDPLIWLYAVTGSKGSRTSWINNKIAYDDLPSDIKDEIDDLKVICGYETGRYSDSKMFNDHIHDHIHIPLVQEFGNKKGLFMPYYQIFDIVDYDNAQELLDYLWEHCCQEKYMVHWDWEDGDLNIAEQLLTIHKRWHFDGMGKRLLWRVASEYGKVYHTS